MEIKQAIRVLFANTDEKISEVYDSNEEVAIALNTLIVGFEYPNHSHKTIKAVLLNYFLSNRVEMELGRKICTSSLTWHCRENGFDLFQFFFNHSQCNWGILSDDDQISNYVALHTQDGYILTRYKLADGKPIYLFTNFESEEEERRTTAMFTSEY